MQPPRGLVDRLDDLAERFQEALPGPTCSGLGGGPDDIDLVVGTDRPEFFGSVAFVGDEGLASAAGEQCRVDVKQVSGSFAFVGLGVGQGEGYRRARGGGEDVEAQTREAAGMAGAVAVAGVIRAFGGFSGAATFDRGGVDEPYVVMPGVAVGGEELEGGTHNGDRAPKALVVAGAF